MSKIVKLVISDDTFGGFERYFEINSDHKINDLVIFMVKSLKDFLKNNNLVEAIRILELKEFHIHSSLNNIIMDNANSIVYVCSH